MLIQNAKLNIEFDHLLNRTAMSSASAVQRLTEIVEEIRREFIEFSFLFINQSIPDCLMRERLGASNRLSILIQRFGRGDQNGFLAQEWKPLSAV